MYALPRERKLKRPAYAAIQRPSSKIEYAFYFAMLYSLTADVWGISVPLLAGALMLGVAALCLLQLRSYLKVVYAPIALLFLCAITYVLIQVVIHDESLTGQSTRSFIIWILQLIIVHSLCLRPRFSYRYPLVLFVVALLSVPYLAFNPGEVERARVDVDLGLQGGLSHPNGLGEWFGFFAVYFAIYGLETKRFMHRSGAWVLAVGSLLVVGLTVSRGSLLAAALAIVVAFRALLRRGFVPVFVLIILTGVTYESGLFDQAISRYKLRAMEETGRERIWPAVMDRILAAPAVGVGASQVGTSGVLSLVTYTPHNTFLFFALSSGVVPLAFFVAFWLQAGWRSAVHAKIRNEDSFRIPYLVFTLVVTTLGDLGFMSPWGLLALSVGAGSAVVNARQHLPVMRVANKVRSGFLPVRGLRRQILLRRYRS